MRPARTLCVFAFSILAALAACAEEEAVDALLAEFTGQAPAVERTPAQLQIAYARLLDRLLPGLAAETLTDRGQAQQDFQRICFRAGRPDADPEREALCKLMAQHLDADTPKLARVWLLRQLERLGQAEECAEPVAALLRDDDAELRDLARRVLQNLSGDVPQLRQALLAAKAPAWRVALVNALAARRDAAAVPQLCALAREPEPTAAAAAVAALADIGTREALDALVTLWQNGLRDQQPAVAVALLRFAEHMVDAGQAPQAAHLCTTVWESSLPMNLRTAALCGLAAADPEQAAPVLRSLAEGSEDTQLRQLAIRLLAEHGGPDTSEFLVAKLPRLPGPAQIVALDALGTRGDVAAKPALITALDSEDVAVRTAAVAALQELGDAADIGRLATIAAESQGMLRETAQKTLARLRGEQLDDAILTQMRSAEPPVRAVLIRVLKARVCRAALPALYGEVAHANEDVAVAAFEGLGALCTASDAHKLVELLMKTAGETVRTAAEDAVAAVCQRTEDEDQRAEPVLAAWATADTHGQAALVRILARLGGAAALAKVREARRSADTDLMDAAVRALASWPTADALDDVLDIAQHTDGKAHRVLALQAYIRMIGLPNEREPQATFDMFKTAMSLAERPEEQKAVLSGLAEVGCLDALNFTATYLDNDDLRAEAEVSAARIAYVVGPQHRQPARTITQRILDTTQDTNNRQRAERVLAHIRESESAVIAWVYAGPFSLDGQEFREVFAFAFPPELLGREKLEWKPLKITAPREPWTFDLTKLDTGSNRCVYVHAAVWSEAEQEARLAIGSDGGVRAWFNGQLVHEFNGIRPHKPLEDKISVTLRAGWNPLLLKIVQAGGDWAFSCAVLTPDGDPLPGLKFEATPP
jgi:HEAT repeat protein